MAPARSRCRSARRSIAAASSWSRARSGRSRLASATWTLRAGSEAALGLLAIPARCPACAGGRIRRPAARLPDILPGERRAVSARPLLKETRVRRRSSDHIMIAHSFRGDVFGPAQALHGATFWSRVRSWRRSSMPTASSSISAARSKCSRRRCAAQLQEPRRLPEFKGVNTTTELLTKLGIRSVRHAARADKLGRDGREISAIRVTCRESHERARLVRGAVVVKGDSYLRCRAISTTPTGGYAYDRRMIAELRDLGWRPEVLDLGEGFPRPTALTRACARRRT